MTQIALGAALRGWPGLCAGYPVQGAADQPVGTARRPHQGLDEGALWLVGPQPVPTTSPGSREEWNEKEEKKEKRKRGREGQGACADSGLG